MRELYRGLIRNTKKEGLIVFNSQHWKIKLVYIGFGSLLGCLCTIIGMLASPATAQKDKFGEIECTKLTLIDPITGNTTAELRTDEHGGLLYLFGSNENRGGVRLGVDNHGGGLTMFSNLKISSAHVSASMGTSKEGTGVVSINHKNGGGVFISATKRGGGFLHTKGANHDNSLASIGASDDGESGLITVSRYKHGKENGVVQLLANNNGGAVSIYGKTDEKSRVVVGINEYGNGFVSTWEKNGYRQ